MGDTLRVLLVEDSEADAQVLLFELRQAVTTLSSKESKPVMR